MRAPRTASIALSLGLLLAAGCTPAPETLAPPAVDPEPSPAPVPEPDPDTDPEDALPDPPPRPPAAPDTATPADCDDATRERIEATLSTQLDAFAADDLAGAYAMTSPFFRNFYDVDAFATLILDGYPQLVGNDGHRFDECRTVGRRAFIVVGVRASDTETVLRYDLSEEPEGWRIDGARTLDGVVLPPAPLV